MTKSAAIALMIAQDTPLGPAFAVRTDGRNRVAISTLLPNATKAQALAFLHAIGAADVWLWGKSSDRDALQARLESLGLLPIDRPLWLAQDALHTPWSLDALAHRVGVPESERQAAEAGLMPAFALLEEVWQRYLKAHALHAQLLPETPDITDWTHALSRAQTQRLSALRQDHPGWSDCELALALLQTEPHHRLVPLP